MKIDFNVRHLDPLAVRTWLSAKNVEGKGEHLKVTGCPCAWKADCAATSLIGVQLNGCGTREKASRRKQTLLVDANFHSSIFQVDLL